jgi:hypothetical protein
MVNRRRFEFCSDPRKLLEIEDVAFYDGVAAGFIIEMKVDPGDFFSSFSEMPG